MVSIPDEDRPIFLAESLNSFYSLLSTDKTDSSTTVSWVLQILAYNQIQAVHVCAQNSPDFWEWYSLLLLPFHFCLARSDWSSSIQYSSMDQHVGISMWGCILYLHPNCHGLMCPILLLTLNNHAIIWRHFTAFEEFNVFSLFLLPPLETYWFVHLQGIFLTCFTLAGTEWPS